MSSSASTCPLSSCCVPCPCCPARRQEQVQETSEQPPQRRCCFSVSTWFPSLRLLSSPTDFVVTTNHSSLWQKHVAWAKPDGGQLKQYITGHYASNMILLSLLLATTSNVFFGSSHELATMRRILLGDNEEYWNQVKFWTGLLMLSGIFVTLLGLITTFTLWCMIAAISDANAHVILRSSLGQYAISLPPRLVVTSLYIFLAWMCLFCGELVVAPAAVVLVTTVVLFFVFVIVVPLSALSRLILHTGAMAARPILSPALERQLIPTGLYASLLLRATHRQRCNPSNVTRQYQNIQNNQNPAIVAVSSMEQPAADDNDEELVDHERQQAINRQKVTNQELSDDTGQSTMSLSGPNDQVQSEGKEQVSWALQKQQPPPPQRRRQHNRRPSEFPLPHASILNAAVTGQELRQLLDLSSSSTTGSERPPLPINSYTDTALGLHGWSNALPPMMVTHPDDAVHATSHKPNTTTTSTLPEVDVEENLVSSTSVRTTDTTTHTSKMMFRHHRRASSAALLLNEWTEDVHVRDLYGADMPAELIDSPPVEEQQQQQTDSPIRQQQVFIPESSSSPGPTFPHLLRESFSWWGNSTNHASLAQLSEDEIVAHPNHDNDEHDNDDDGMGTLLSSGHHHHGDNTARGHWTEPLLGADRHDSAWRSNHLVKDWREKTNDEENHSW